MSKPVHIPAMRRRDGVLDADDCNVSKWVMYGTESKDKGVRATMF